MVAIIFSPTVKQSLINNHGGLNQIRDRAERPDFSIAIVQGSSRKAWLLTTTLVFLFPSKKRKIRKGESIAKIMIKSHVFLLDLNSFLYFLIFPQMVVYKHYIPSFIQMCIKYCKLKRNFCNTRQLTFIFGGNYSHMRFHSFPLFPQTMKGIYKIVIGLLKL